jgi:DNA-binding NarL/FixJ family response regulator
MPFGCVHFLMQKPGTPIRVIVIDHRALIRSALAVLIDTRPEFQVVAVAGKDLASRDAALRQHPDVAVLNLGPDTNHDLAFLANLRAATPPVRVLVVTEGAERELHQEAIRMGASGVMSPESSPDALIKALDCIARGEYWIDRVTAAALANASRTGQRSPSGSNGAGIAALTARERSIMTLIADGLRNKEIGVRLNISEITVRHHLTSIFAKLGVPDRLALIVYAFRQGFVSAAPQRAAVRNEAIVKANSSPKAARD